MSEPQKSRPNHTGRRDNGDSGRESDSGKDQATGAGVSKPPPNDQSDPATDPLATIVQSFRDTEIDPEEIKAVIAEHDQKRGRIPEEFERYRIKKRLGAGGMGSVYLAHDTQLDRQVALKVPFFDTDDEACIERFYREARAAATLDHPYLCPVYDVGVINGTHYLTMAYIRGKTLKSVIRKGGVPANQVAAFIRKIALALDEAHQKGVIHRDLKPDNIMIDRRRQPVVMDFGLAQRMGSSDPRITRKDSFIGTPAYMSPEQISDPSTVGPATDIFSLGIITYELLVGERPFQAEDAISTLGAILTKEPENPKTWSVELDSEIEAICLRALEKKVKNRYLSMKEFGDALKEYLTRNLSKTADPSDEALSEADSNSSPSPGEETLVHEMLKEISVSSTSQSVSRRSLPRRRSNKAVWIAMATLASVILLLVWLALRDDADPLAESTLVNEPSLATNSRLQTDERREGDFGPTSANPNRSLRSQPLESIPVDRATTFERALGGIAANDSDGVLEEPAGVSPAFLDEISPKGGGDASSEEQDSVNSEASDDVDPKNAKSTTDSESEKESESSSPRPPFPAAESPDPGEDRGTATPRMATPGPRQDTRSVRLPRLLRRGLVAHFPLDESGGREAANAVLRQPGGVYVGPGEPTWVAGVIGNAVHLSDGCFDCGKNINPSNYTAFSFGCWYSSDEPQYAALIAKTDSANDYSGFELYLGAPRPDSPFRERLSFHLTDHSMGQIKREVNISELESGWHHVFATYDGSGKARGTRVYVDGRTVGVIRYDALRGTLQNNVPLLIGRRSEQDQYRGRIDDVRIYDRVITPHEVRQLFEHGLQSVANVPVEERTIDQKELLRRVVRDNENSDRP